MLRSTVGRIVVRYSDSIQAPAVQVQQQGEKARNDPEKGKNSDKKPDQHRIGVIAPTRVDVHGITHDNSSDETQKREYDDRSPTDVELRYRSLHDIVDSGGYRDKPWAP